jgi:Uma2 family endonuclease
MATLLRLGPADHGRYVTDEDLEAAHFEEGYRYEVIDGKLFVSPTPDLSHDILERWLCHGWEDYSRQHPEVVNYLTVKARIFIPGRPRLTVPEPDLAAYQNFPLDTPRAQQDWRLVSPVFVAEIVSPDNPDKDLIRNVGLYLQVPSIREYWILDPRDGPVRLLIRRRRGSRWQNVIEVAEGETVTSRHFPGLEMTMTPPP